MSGVKFRGKVAIVTGSSRGIGKAIAIALAKNGATVVLNGRNAQRLHQVENEIRKYNAKVISVCCDVSTADGGQRLIEETIREFQRIDMLINNVGISMRGNVADVNPEVFRMVFDSNVMGSVYPTIPALMHLRASKGNLVFISSEAGIRGLPLLSAYCSSKMALRAIAESIRIEEIKHKVHVGLVLVGMTANEHDKETISADGSMRLIAPRNSKKVLSTEMVAEMVLKNISRRKFISVLTFMGKLNAFLQPRFPWLVEKLIARNIRKFEEGAR